MLDKLDVNRVGIGHLKKYQVSVSGRNSGNYREFRRREQKDQSNFDDTDMETWTINADSIWDKIVTAARRDICGGSVSKEDL